MIEKLLTMRYNYNIVRFYYMMLNIHVKSNIKRRMNMDWGFTLSVVFVGLVVVFSVLIALVLMCVVIGKIFAAINKKKNGIVKEKPAPEVKQPAKATVINATPAPVVESGIGDDVVAAISAAIACITGDKGGITIKSIKRAKGSRPVWNTASVMENTRPF